MKGIYLIQITDSHSVLSQQVIVGREKADKVYNSLNPETGHFVTMNKADKAFNGCFVRGEYIKHKPI